MNLHRLHSDALPKKYSFWAIGLVLFVSCTFSQASNNSYRIKSEPALNILSKHSIKKPNIIFILSDDQRWDAMSCAGHPVLKTPNIDRIAAHGTRFRNAFVTSPICCVSRGSVLTGQYAMRNGVDDFFTDAKLETTYPKYLRENGYYTGFIGKWGVNAVDKGSILRSADLFVS